MNELKTLFKDVCIQRRSSKKKIKDIAREAFDDGFTSIVYINESRKKISKY